VKGPAASVIIFTDLVEGPVGVLNPQPVHDLQAVHTLLPLTAEGQVVGPAASVINFTDLVEGPVGVLNPEPAHDLQAVHTLLLLPLLVDRSAQSATI
jgi:hypothetical protein